MAELAPVRVALVGAGGFVRDSYIPALAEVKDRLLVVACWSRTPDTIWSVLPAIQAFSPSCAPYHGDGCLQALLSSPEVDAVLVVLPPQAQGAVVQAALRAGKHVMSEKPAAPTLALAEQLLAFHRSLPQPAPLWCVAENYRSMDCFLRMRQSIAAGQLGTLVRLDMAADLALAPGSKYYDSAWRRDSASMPGAYLTEGGVHFVSALRMAAGAAGFGEATLAVAAARGVSQDLPHPDCLQGLLWFESGASAGVSITTAAGHAAITLHAVGTAGTAEAARGGLGAAPGGRAFRLVQQGAADAAPVLTESGSSGVAEELLCFARLARAAGRPLAPDGTSPAGHPLAPGATSLALTPREAGAAAATDRSDPEKEAVAVGVGGRQGAGAGAGAGGGSASGRRAGSGAAGAAAAGGGVAGTSVVEGTGAGGAAPGVGAVPKAAEPAAPAAVPAVQPHVTERGSGAHAALQEIPSEEDAYRISAVEAARDLAVVAALLDSAARGGEMVAVAQV